MDVDVDSVMEILLFGLLSCYAAVATTAILALATMAVVVTIAVYGLSFFFSSVVADAETIMVAFN